MTAPQSPNAAANRRALIILAIGLALALVFFLVTRVAGGGGGEEEVIPTTSTTQARVTTTTTAPGGAVTETFEVFSTKNPFIPLRTAGGTSGTGTSTSTGTTGSTGSTSTGGTSGTSGTSATGGTGSTAAAGSGSTEPQRSTRVALLDVFAESDGVVANVRVNDQVHKVAQGETFATSFKVLSLSQSTDCGQFLFGDDQFRLCKGEETLK